MFHFVAVFWFDFDFILFLNKQKNLVQDCINDRTFNKEIYLLSIYVSFGPSLLYGKFVCLKKKNLFGFSKKPSFFFLSFFYKKKIRMFEFNFIFFLKIYKKKKIIYLSIFFIKFFKHLYLYIYIYIFTNEILIIFTKKKEFSKKRIIKYFTIKLFIV